MRNAPKFYTKYAHDALTVSECKTEVTGAQGYRSALATSRRCALPLYFESQIENSAGYARIGVATTECELNGPIGIDERGYSYGSKNGYSFHKSKRVRMGERYGRGDVVSVYLYRTKKYGLALEFFLNGERAGKPLEIGNENEYWPAVSVYGGCSVRLNMGPYFAYEAKIKNRVDMQSQLAGRAASPAKEKKPARERSTRS